MLHRSAWSIPIALVATTALALPLTAQAAPSTPSPSSGVKAKIANRRSSTVTLPTGDHVRLTTTAGKVQVDVQPAVTSGPGRVLTTQRHGSEVYVVPAVAKPYLGRFLDQSLFDVTQIKRGLRSDGRLPVRISYHGSTPSVPGVNITSATAGVAKGYLTPSSSAAFGQALTTQWKADSKAGWPARSTLFDDVTKISSDLPAVPGATPKYPMFTLIVKVKGPDGKPLPDGEAVVTNVDNTLKYVGFVGIQNGEARISVPKGNYDAIADDFEYNDTTSKSTIRVATAGNYQVTGAGQTMTVDLRKATVNPTASVPKKAAFSTGAFTWDRYDAAKTGSFTDVYSLDSSTTLYLAPSKPAKIGAQDSVLSWNLVGSGRAPAYTYDLASYADQIPATAKHIFTAGDLATGHANYYGDGTTKTGGFGRSAVFPAQEFTFTSLNNVARPSRRVEYVGVTGASASWTEVGLLNADSFDDPGFVDGPLDRIPAGTAPTFNWFRGPLGAAIPAQVGAGYCYACRTSKALEVGMAPFTDSVSTHTGELFGALDGLPVARFRLYKNSTLLFDQDDYLGADVAVPTANATYKAILDVDLRLQKPNQSTQSHTELTFKSAKGGPKLPSDWYCDLGTACNVLPILQAKLALPTSLTGTLPLKQKSAVTVTVSQIQNAARSAITSAGLEIRPAGDDWITVKLKSAGEGKYTGIIDNADYAGSDVDVRISGADKAGSSFQQTVLSAYTVASK